MNGLEIQKINQTVHLLYSISSTFTRQFRYHYFNFDDFDVPMGGYDGTEIRKLVLTYLLNQLKVVIVKEIMRLYRDNGLGIFKNMSGPKVERKKINIVKIFKNNALSITVKTSLTAAYFLDIHFDLVKEIYLSYKNLMITPCTLTKNPIIDHQYCNNWRN